MATDTEQTRQFSQLLTYLERSRGFDFSGYKKTTLGRRIEKRMAAVGADNFAAYEDHLEANPREFTELFNTILINVTSFFRDAPAWDFVRDDVLPDLLASIPDNRPLRIWSAGCASGEEAYTIAMVLAEKMGADAFKANVKIYATDIDDNALSDARQGIYPNEALKAVPEPLIEKYFEPNPRRLAFRPDLRRAIIFGRNDLMLDAPISRIDLLVCRNVLMYFTPEAQARILERFNFALNPNAFLFLGKPAMLVSHGELFSPHDIKWRLFRKVPRNNLRERLAFIGPGAFADPGTRDDGVRSVAAALSPVARIVVGRDGSLVDANRRARDLFGIVEGDIGKPFQDVPVSYRPADLRSAIERSREERGPVQLQEVTTRESAGDRVLDIEIQPVIARDGEELGTSITFNDVTALVRLREDYQRSKRELENAYEELQSTVEELETTNEELQSTNEELETTNEELQSTNEELETMNEELQSTNDELETMNDELHLRTDEVNEVNAFLESILASLDTGVAVLDQDLRVAAWNDGARDLWGLRADEAEGQYFLNLDIGLPLDALRSELRNALAGEPRAAVEVAATDRRGRPITCRVRVSPLGAIAGVTVRGLIVFMESIAP